jgi:hypothetical protein
MQVVAVAVDNLLVLWVEQAVVEQVVAVVVIPVLPALQIPVVAVEVMEMHRTTEKPAVPAS